MKIYCYDSKIEMLGLTCVVVLCIVGANPMTGAGYSRTESTENNSVTNPNILHDVTSLLQEAANSTQAVTSSFQNVTLSDQDVTSSFHEVTNYDQEVTYYDQVVTNSEQEVTSSFHKDTNYDQEVTNSEQEVTSSFQKVNGTQANQTSDRNLLFDSFTTDMYVQVSISVVGIFGNTFSLAILHRQNLSKLPCLFYLKMLTLSDAIYLLFLNLAGSQVSVTRYLITSHPLVCKLGIYFLIISLLLPKYIMMAISFERFIVVLFPLRGRYLLKKRYARVYVVSALVFLLIMCVPIIAIFGISQEDDHHASTCFLQEDINPVLDKILTGTSAFNNVFPGLVILICNVSMFVKLAYSRVIRKRLTGNNQPTQQKKSGTNALLLTIGFSHLILALPQAVIIALDVDIIVADPVPLYFTAAKAMYFLNYAGDFLLYTMGGSIIRNEIRIMFLEMLQVIRGCRQSNELI